VPLRRLLAVGTAAGIEIRDGSLYVAVTRVRPSGVEVPGALEIAGWQARPAFEWAAEYHAFLRRLGLGRLSAVLLLPRRDVIVRLLHLPGVEDKDLPAALSFQIEALHPYGDEAVAWAWQRVSASGAVLVGLVRQQTLDGWLDRFAEAGIALAGVTFSAAALHAAARLYAPPAGEGRILVYRHPAGETVELYGESASRPVFSAEFDLPLERALPLACAELRLAASEPAPWEQFLPAPRLSTDFDFSRSAFVYAAALAGACPRLAPAANLLPESQRVVRSRAVLAPTLALAALLLLAVGALAGVQGYREKQYLLRLQEEIARLEPKAALAARYDQAIANAQRRHALLAGYRKRTRADLDALRELTRLIAPPAWTNLVQVDRASVTLAGEAEQAAPLLQVLDNSPLFRNSQFTVAIARTAAGDLFRIRSEREGQP